MKAFSGKFPLNQVFLRLPSPFASRDFEIAGDLEIM